MSAIKNWKVKKVKLANIKPFPGNPRTISKKAQEGLRKSIERFGYVEPIVWNERTGHILGGHQRYAILIEKGVEEATMVVVDLSPEEEAAVNITLNNPKIEGEFDDTVLDLLKSLEGDTEAFSDLRLDALRTSLEASFSKPSKEGEEQGKEQEDEKTKDALPDLKPDTKCPCCGYEFRIEPKDVTVVSSEECVGREAL